MRAATGPACTRPSPVDELASDPDNGTLPVKVTVMPQLAISHDPQRLALMVRNYYQRWRFLAVATIPDVIGGPDKYALYGSEKDCEDATAQALADYPHMIKAQPIEYLPPEELARIKALGQSPVAKAMRNLGLVKPDGTPLN